MNMFNLSDDEILDAAQWAETVRYFGKRHKEDPPEDDGFLKPRREPYWMDCPERYQLAKTVGLVSGT